MSGEGAVVGESIPSVTVDNTRCRKVAATLRATRTTLSEEQGPMGTELMSESRGESPSSGYAPITVGVCAMNKKTMAQPMKNILSRLAQEPAIELVMFTDHTILNEPVEDWPICHSLIAFYSDGFPLEKAIEYVKLRKPLVLNDLQSQYALMDRRKVYEILMKNGVEVPRHMIVNRGEDSDHTDGSCREPQVLETDDLLEINGTAFHKPFVEKPINAENHNIYIYFPSDYGGGSQRLFRKVKNRSSTYSKVSAIRTTGSFIYEEFMPTDGTDVKVYTVGPDYAHAEARKSPALDGKVERDENGKEIRHPVLLTAQEKLIARKVCLAFKQTVCGFDLLRANGKSYVCDVNGFSFVKKSQKYYDDCAQILLETIIGNIAPHYFPLMPPSVEYLAEEVPDLPVPIPATNNTFELRCVVGVIRHGDRTPKQKMKMIVKHRRFFELFETFNGYEKGELKLKKPKELQMVLDISRDLLDEIEQGSDDEHEVEEKVHKLKQLKTVLEMYGTFSGINRKVQFKLITKRQGEPCHVLLLILKWGGELTPAGMKQAEEYGRTFRCTYPGGEGEYSSLPGSGFLRLHSTYRHDLKVYASDEGRVQMTAAAFTKGLLDLEGSLASVLVHLVKRDQAATNMLDTFTDAQDAMSSVKERLHEIMRSEENFNEDSYSELAPPQAESILEAMHRVKNPHCMCVKLHQMISQLLAELREIAKTTPSLLLYQGETLDLMIKRWVKLEKDFRHKKGHFDISKVPDIYDCIKYDLLHNSKLNLKNAKDLFNRVMPMADIVIPQEYGITVKEKLDIAKKICSPLLRKIQADLHHTIINEQEDFIHRLDPLRSKGVVSPNRHVRTRLYFTSESHVHSLLNILKYNGLVKDPDIDPRWKEAMDTVRKAPELNYMTQIVFMLFEDTSKPEGSLDKYHVDIHFSPGIKGRRELIVDGSSSLVKNSSPELPEKSPQVFVKRLSHIAVVGGSSEGGKASSSTCVPSWTKSSGDGLKSGTNSATTIHGDFFRRYAVSSRSAAPLNTSSSSRLSPKDVHRGRRDSAPNALRSISDTRLVDMAKKMEKQEEAEHGNGHTHRKKSASESWLKSLQELTFTIGCPSSGRSKSDGDITEDDSPKLRTSSKLAGSSPDLNHDRTSVCPYASEKLQPKENSKGPAKKLSAPSMTYRYVAKPPDTTAAPLPSSSSKKPNSPLKKHSTPSFLFNPLEKQQDTAIKPSSVSRKQAFPSRKRLAISPVSSSTKEAPSLTVTTINEQRESADDGNNNMNKWGSIELLQDSVANEMGKDSQWTMVERGVEMASELATQIEPLIHIASMSLKDTDSFLTTLTGVKLDYHEASSRDQTRPHSAVIHRRSSSEEPSQKRVTTSTMTGQRHRRFCAGSASPSEELPTTLQASPPSTLQPNHLSSSHGVGRTGHRNSVGSIDTDTFGKRNGDVCLHTLTHHHHCHLLQPSVMDSSYIAQHMYVNHSSTCSWSRGVDSNSNSNSSSVHVLPGSSCD